MSPGADQASTEQDALFMQRALELAARGLYTTAPNPRVGCLLVTAGGQVVGEGWHRRAGEDHAEIKALAEAGRAARGATAYVTLEPCCHHGRTGPCTDALIGAGVARVVIAVADPFPEVNGQGVAQLRQAGIRVDCAVLEDQARELNIGFFSRIEQGRPFVRMKAASSLDGASAMHNGASQWITSPQARDDNHHYRARASMMLTGIGTVLSDDPRMTARISGLESQPDLVIVDRQARLPRDARVLDGSRRVIWVVGPQASLPDWAKRCEVIRLESAADDTKASIISWGPLLSALADRQCNELHVEAGARVQGSLLMAGWVDELLLYQAPVIMGHRTLPLFETPTLEEFDQRIHLQYHHSEQLGGDMKLLLRPGKYACSPES